MRPAAARPPHPSLPKGEIPMCFPLGPKTDLPGGGKLPPFRHPSYSSFSFRALDAAQPLGARGTRTCFTPTVCNFGNAVNLALAFWNHFKQVGVGEAHTHARAHSRIHAGLSLLIACGQRLATLWVTQPACPPAPRTPPPTFPSDPRCWTPGWAPAPACTAPAGSGPGAGLASVSGQRETGEEGGPQSPQTGTL